MKIVFFSSYTSIFYFAFAEAVLAFELQKKGHDVVFITPGDSFTGRSDLLNESVLRKEFNLKGYEIGSIITEEDKKEINVLMESLDKNNFENLKIDNVNIGKIALYEFLLKHKKLSCDFTEEEWGECLTELKNTLVSFFACRSVLNNEKPDRIVMYNTLYSVNHVWEKFAKYQGVPSYFMHNGLNLSDIDNTLIVAKGNAMYYLSELRDIWHSIKEKPVTHDMLRYVTDHFVELLKAKHYLVYSAPKSKETLNIKNTFNIKEGKKILVAVMSSYDELFAAEYIGVRTAPKDLIFASQVDWIRALIDFVRERADLFLIIRVHPREFPNKRDGVKSEHAKVLEEKFKSLPHNVKINWPEENISLYDLALETDVFLNGWSSAGVEMSLLGIPVVTYSKELISYPADLNYVAADSGDYFGKIDSALKDGWSYERIKNTYRWLALYYCGPIMRLRNKNLLTNSVERSSNPVLKKMRYVRNVVPIPKSLAQFIKNTKIKHQRTKECNLHLATQSVDISGVEQMLIGSKSTIVNPDKFLVNKVTCDEEDYFVRVELKRLYNALFGNVFEERGINSLQQSLKQIIEKA